MTHSALSLSSDLIHQVTTTYQLGQLTDFTQLTGGYECDVWRAKSNRGWVVVRISPAWRDADRLRWKYKFARYLVASIPQVVAPLLTKDGDTLMIYEGQPVIIQPYIEGETLNRDDESLRQASAKLLAQIHLKSHEWGMPPYPAKSEMIDADNNEIELPPEIQDPQLDEWRASIDSGTSLIKGAVHGDYYRGNILTQDGNITGVLDWDESRIDWYLEELAWSVWEFCKVSTGDDLHRDRAQHYIRAYCDNNPLCNDVDMSMIIPFIRWRLHEEIKRSLIAEVQGEDWDDEYRQIEIRAFVALKELEP